MIYRFFCWFLILFACFYGLGSIPLLDDMEGLYASIARDMLKTHQFIIPHLNGLPYLEKPPLLYWLLAASMSIFGVGAGAARLIPALALFATARMMQRLIQRATRSEEAGFAAALIMVTSLPLFAIGRMVLCDMLMTYFLTASLGGFYEWYISPPSPLKEKEGWEVNRILQSKSLFPSLTLKRQGKLYQFYGFLALAVLTKGFVTIILAVGAIALFLFAQRSPRQRWLHILSPSGILLFLLIATPWHIAAVLQEPGFAWFYFINEHLLRFLNMRQPHDYYTGYAWYYLPRILIYLMPWTPFLALFSYKLPPTGTKPPTHYQTLPHFLWSWFLFSLLFFSASGAKANYYMIAGMPALIMLLALRLKGRIEPDHRILHKLAAMALSLTIIVLPVIKYFCHIDSGELYPACEALSWGIMGEAALFVAIAAALCYRLPPRWTVPLVASSILWLLPLLSSALHAAESRLSQQPVAAYLKQSGYDNAALYQEFEEWSALAFYLDQPLPMVDTQSNDLLYGQRQSHGGFIPLSSWGQKPQWPLLVSISKLDKVLTQLQAMNIGKFCVLRSFERVAVVAPCR